MFKRELGDFGGAAAGYWGALLWRQGWSRKQMSPWRVSLQQVAHDVDAKTLSSLTVHVRANRVALLPCGRAYDVEMLRILARWLSIFHIDKILTDWSGWA